VKIETDHIQPKASQGDDDIKNAIPVCFDCHADIHSYNDEHPRGRKFTPEELQQHKTQWLAVCDTMPAQFLNEHRTADVEVGPVQALIDEIEFNLAAARTGAKQLSGCPLKDEQFARVVRSGSLSLLQPKLKATIINAYVAVGHASVIGQAAVAKHAGGFSHSVISSSSVNRPDAFKKCARLLAKAHKQLLSFLGHD
jgi:hypothetical protein